MRQLRTGARWYLRVALGLVLLFDLGLLAGMLSLGAPTPRTLGGAPPFLLALIGRPELVLPLSALGLVALARFASGPGRVGAALVVLGVVGVLCEARAAESGGPERFLFAGGTVLLGWIAGIAFVRASEGDREAEEIGAEAGAMAALAAMYVNAGLSKLAASGLGWADGDDLRMLVLTQRPFADSAIGVVADLVVGSRALAFGLAAFTELAQLSAVAYPFHARARAVTGTMLLAFHAGVRMLMPISFPQSMALLVIFSYPWRSVLVRRGLASADREDLVLARKPERGALALGAGFALLAGLSLTPPVRGVIASLSHAAELAGPFASERSGSEGRADHGFEPPVLDTASAALLGIEHLGEPIAGCTVASVAAPAPSEIRARFECNGAAIEIEIVASGARPHSAPRSAAGRDLFYRSGTRVSDARRDVLLEELARRLGRAETRNTGEP